MLPIIVKDLSENLKVWVLFAIASAVSTSLNSGEHADQVIQGFTQAITFGSGLIFAHSVVFAERKRRHLVFLKSLPVSDSEIVGAKFISVLVLTLSLTGVPCLARRLLGAQAPHYVTLLSLSLITLYASLVLGLYICFRNPALPFLPLYFSALVVLWGEAKLSHQLTIGTESAAILSLVASVIIYKSALFIFKRKELDF